MSATRSVVVDVIASLAVLVLAFLGALLWLDESWQGALVYGAAVTLGLLVVSLLMQRRRLG